MNYLAHFYLCQNNEDYILGNLIADTIKGTLNSKNFEGIPQSIINGVKLHRSIDFFTDNHSSVKESIHRLQPKYRKYSGILVDMFYDHFLAKNWHKYHNRPLEIFEDEIYDLFKKRKNEIPSVMDRMVNSMIKNKWLSNYKFEENLQWALTGLSKRAKYDSNMEHAIFDLQKDYLLFQNEFETFFPQLKSHCDSFIENLEKS